MIDRKKLVEGLEYCIEAKDKNCPMACPFFKECFSVFESSTPFYPIMRATLELLKEQEPSKPNDAPTVNGWISVKDRMPDKDGKYLCVWQGRSIDTGMFTNGHFRLYGEVKDKLVSHWMPLPDLPKEDKHESNSLA